MESSGLGLISDYQKYLQKIEKISKRVQKHPENTMDAKKVVAMVDELLHGIKSSIDLRTKGESRFKKIDKSKIARLKVIQKKANNILKQIRNIVKTTHTDSEDIERLNVDSGIKKNKKLQQRKLQKEKKSKHKAQKKTVLSSRKILDLFRKTDFSNIDDRQYLRTHLLAKRDYYKHLTNEVSKLSTMQIAKKRTQFFQVIQKYNKMIETHAENEANKVTQDERIATEKKGGYESFDTSLLNSVDDADRLFSKNKEEKGESLLNLSTSEQKNAINQLETRIGLFNAMETYILEIGENQKKTAKSNLRREINTLKNGLSALKASLDVSTGNKKEKRFYDKYHSKYEDLVEMFNDKIAAIRSANPSLEVKLSDLFDFI